MNFNCIDANGLTFRIKFKNWSFGRLNPIEKPIHSLRPSSSCFVNQINKTSPNRNPCLFSCGLIIRPNRPRDGSVEKCITRSWPTTTTYSMLRCYDKWRLLIFFCLNSFFFKKIIYIFFVLYFSFLQKNAEDNKHPENWRLTLPRTCEALLRWALPWRAWWRIGPNPPRVGSAYSWPFLHFRK